VASEVITDHDTKVEMEEVMPTIAHDQEAMVPQEDNHEHLATVRKDKVRDNEVAVAQSECSDVQNQMDQRAQPFEVLKKKWIFHQLVTTSDSFRSEE
jgi:hypothetical protein